MTPARIRWLALVAALLVLAAGYLALYRHVTVLVDGKAGEIVTRTLTVRGALHAAGVRLGPRDEVKPSLFTPLRNGLIIAVHRAAWVQLSVDGKVYETLTAERNPATLLARWGLALGKQDRLVLAGEPVSMDQDLPASWPAVILDLRRPVKITLQQDGRTTEFLSSASTLGQALAEQGIQIRAADQLQPSAETPLQNNLAVELIPARELTIKMGEKTISIYSAAATVGEALANAGISLQEMDSSEPGEEEPIPADGRIRVWRITESVVLEQTVLPHETKWQPDPNADLDTVSVVQEGRDGVQVARTRVRYEDGQEISRQQEEARVLVKAQTQTNGYGTKVVTFTIVVDGITIEYYRAIEVFVTSYSPCGSGTSSCSYGTSSGLPVEKGTIATWINWYRALKGCQLYVPGYGYGVIGDVGAYTPDRSRPWIDLAYSDADYVEWAKWVTIYFTSPDAYCTPAVWPP